MGKTTTNAGTTEEKKKPQNFLTQPLSAYSASANRASSPYEPLFYVPFQDLQVSFKPIGPEEFAIFDGMG